MQDVPQYLDILILALVAVFVGLRLRGVLGRRDEDGEENIPPSSQNESRPPMGEVIRPQAWNSREAPADLPPLQQISAVDPAFSPDGFLNGARTAFGMIIEAFAKGDESTLRSLLSDQVFANFSQAIRARASAGEICANRLEQIVSTEIMDVRFDGRFAHIAVRFVSRQVMCQKDRDGKILFGSEETRHDMTDIWTFARDVGHSDPTWLVTATQSGVEA